MFDGCRLLHRLIHPHGFRVYRPCPRRKDDAEVTIEQECHRDGGKAKNADFCWIRENYRSEYSDNKQSERNRGCPDAVTDVGRSGCMDRRLKTTHPEHGTVGPGHMQGDIVPLHVRPPPPKAMTSVMPTTTTDSMTVKASGSPKMPGVMAT